MRPSRAEVVAAARERQVRPGDRVRLKVLPPWVGTLPKESQEVFTFCVGRTFRVSGIDHNGLLILDVGAVVDPRFGGYGNDIRVEPEFVSVCLSDVR